MLKDQTYDEALTALCVALTQDLAAAHKLAFYDASRMTELFISQVKPRLHDLYELGWQHGRNGTPLPPVNPS